MAFSVPGILGRLLRPRFYTLGSVLPQTDMQVRGYAARKGTREKALKKKRAMKLKKLAQGVKETKKESKKTVTSSGVNKTVISGLSPPPTDTDVYFSDCFQPKEYSIPEAIDCHKENLHPTVLNGEKSNIEILVELDMTAEKKTRTVNPWKSVIVYPNVFQLGFKKTVLVLCQEELKLKALDAGADAAGGTPLIRQIKKGDFNVSLYDRIIAQMAIHDEITAIRPQLKLLYPKPGNDTLTVDFISAVKRFKFGIELTCNLSQNIHAFGWITAIIGPINMDPDELEQNFKALIKHINSKRPKREGDFITHVWCSAPPSRERLKINFKSYQDEMDKSEENTKKASAIEV